MSPSPRTSVRGLSPAGCPPGSYHVPASPTSIFSNPTVIMKRLLSLVLLTAVGVFAPAATAVAQPDTTDTRLLTMPAISADAHRLRLCRRPVGRRPRRQEPPPADHRHRRRNVSGVLARRPDHRLHRAVRRQHRRLHHSGDRRRADALDLAPGAGHRSRLHPRRQDRAVLLAAACVQQPAHAAFHRAARPAACRTQLPIPWGFEAATRPTASTSPTPRSATLTASGSTTAAAPTRASGSTTSRLTSRPRFRSRRIAATISTRTGSATPSTSAPIAPASTTCSLTTPAAKDVKQLTQLRRLPGSRHQHRRQELIFEQAGYLHLLTPGEMRSRSGCRSASRPTWWKPGRGLRRERSTSATRRSRRAVPGPSFEFRGEIVTVPAEKGDPRNLTNTAGVHERGPAWSPDGKTIAYFSDAGGEYQLTSSPPTARASAKTYALGGAGYYERRSGRGIPRRSPSWTTRCRSSGSTSPAARSRRSPRTAIRPSAVAAEAGAGRRTRSGSPTTLATRRPTARVFVYSLEQDKSSAITDGLTEASIPSSTRAASTCTSSARPTPA